MKKLSMLILVLAMMAVLAVSASASLVIYQNGAAENNVVQGNAGALNISFNLDEPVDIYDYDYMYIRFYCENPEAYMNNGQIELTSSGQCDVEETNWDVNSLEIQQGWNDWVIDLWTPNGTGADYEKINYFRVYFFTDGANYVSVDYVAFGGEDEDFSSIATEFGQEVVLEEYVAEDVITRSSTIDGTAGACVVSASLAATPVNISEYDYMFVRLYVEGLDNFSGDGQMELTSKATCDIEEMHWNMSNVAVDLQDGWNEIMIDLYLPDAMDASFNWENCNWFRIYQFASGTLTMELDYVGFGMEDDVFGEDTLPAYLVRPMSQDPVVEETAEEAAPAEEAAEEAAPAEATEEAAPAEEAAAEEAPAEATEEAAEAVNGVIEATAGNAGETADMLFDGDENTKWCLAGAEAYVIWKTDTTYATGYEIVTANDNAEYPGRNPGAWTLSGSNDGENWTVIDAVEGDTVLQDVNFTPFTFDIDAPAEYSYYKLEVSDIESGTLQISGLNLLTGAVPAVDDVAETPEEVVAPVETVEEPAEAPQTFDAGIIAAVAAIISAAGYAISKKR